ncbi:hypothetical protein [Microbacterium resistens]
MLKAKGLAWPVLAATSATDIRPPERAGGRRVHATEAFRREVCRAAHSVPLRRVRGVIEDDLRVLAARGDDGGDAAVVHRGHLRVIAESDRAAAERLLPRADTAQNPLPRRWTA